MYPQLFNQASRLAPVLSRILSRGGSFATPFWKTQQIDVPDVNAQPVPARDPHMPTVPISQDNSGAPNYSAGASPQDRLNYSFDALKGVPQVLSANQPNAMDTMQWPYGPVGAPQASAGLPLPRPRPPEATPDNPPPDTSFFMRNALMQQDPMGGGYIDPTGAASVRGPDLISKMMTYLHSKA